MRRRLGEWAIITLMLLWASGSWGMDPAVRCQVDKLKIASKYTACRLKAEADAVKHFAQPDFSACDAAFNLAWEGVEMRTILKGTPCWSTGDALNVQNAIDAHLDALAAGLSKDGGK